MSRGRMLIGEPTSFTAPQYGLLNAATQLDLADGHWRRGIVWEPLCPEAAGTYEECFLLDGTPAPLVKEATTEWQVRGATPFTAYSRIDCSPVGMWDQLSDRNRQALLRAEASYVEEVFWTGIAAPNTSVTVFPNLTSPISVVDGEDLLQPQVSIVTLDPQPIEVGIGMLEDAMRDCYPGVPTLHVPLRLGSLMADASLLAPRGAVMYTTSAGSKVALGNYPGTAPNNIEQPGVTWVYATGEVFFQRETTPTVFTNVASLDRSVNTLSVLAERTYVIGWDCCLLAIPIINNEVITS